jgi:hypothetical protein
VASGQCNADECCKTVYTMGSSVLSDAAVLSDKSYTATWAEYSDSACTVSRGSRGVITTPSATCKMLKTSSGATDKYGIFLYCGGAGKPSGMEYGEHDSKLCANMPTAGSAVVNGNALFSNVSWDRIGTCMLANPGDSTPEYAKMTCTPNGALPPLPPPPPIPPAPPPVAVSVTLVTYNATAKTEAVAAISSELQAFLAAPPPPSGSPPPPVATVAAQATFPIQITAIDAGTPARASFEADFKTAMAAQLGNGLYNASDITIVQIVAGSVKVDWTVQAPPSVAAIVANLVKTVQPAAISITVNGTSVTPTALAAPTVTQTPDTNCVGAWSACASSGQQQYVVTTVKSGTGSACAATHAAIRTCTLGAKKGSAAKTSAGFVSLAMAWAISSM